MKDDGEAVSGDEVINFLLDQFGSGVSEDVKRFQKRLDEINMGIVTYGLAFHQDKTKVLRFPFCEEEFFEKVK